MVTLGKLGSAATTPTTHTDSKHSDSGEHLLRDGSVALTGALDMGTNAITNAGAGTFAGLLTADGHIQMAAGGEIRDSGGSSRIEVATASPHVITIGNTQLGSAGDSTGISSSPSPTDVLSVGNFASLAAGFSFSIIRFPAGTLVDGDNVNLTYFDVAGTINNTGRIGTDIIGLSFQPSVRRGSLDLMIGIRVRPTLQLGPIVTLAQVILAEVQNSAGPGADSGTVVGVDIQNVGHANWDNVYGLRIIDQIAGGTLTRPISQEGTTGHNLFAAESRFSGSVTIGDDVAPDELLHLLKAVDGSAVGLLVENSQPNAAASLNETADIRFGFGGNNDVARIVAEKAEDFTVVANETAELSFFIRNNGATERTARIRGGGVLELFLGTTQIQFKHATPGGSSPGGPGILYLDSGSVVRNALMFPGSDLVVLSNRALNGEVQIRANVAAGGGGEQTVARFQDDQVRLLQSALIGADAAPATSAVLELQSVTGALLLSRMTTTQRDALTAVDGMELYNSTLAQFQGRVAGAWVDLGAGGGGALSFTEAFTVLTNPAATGVWEVESASPAPANSVALILLRNSHAAQEVQVGVREVGSALSRIVDLHEAEAGGENTATTLVNVDASGNVELFRESAGTPSFVTIGYWS